MQQWSKAEKKKRDARFLRKRLSLRNDAGYLKRTDGKVTIIPNMGAPIVRVRDD